MQEEIIYDYETYKDDPVIGMAVRNIHTRTCANCINSKDNCEGCIQPGGFRSHWKGRKTKCKSKLK